MFNYGGDTPKPETATSNSKEIGRLNNGKLQGWDSNNPERTLTVSQYEGKDGKKCWTGNANMKRSQ